MGNVIAAAVVSLDGFVADTEDGVDPLFDWYNNGPVELYGTDPGRPFHVSPASADYVNTAWRKVGVVLCGRRLFDITNGWEGVPPFGQHVVVVTHEPPTDWPFPMRRSPSSAGSRRPSRRPRSSLVIGTSRSPRGT